MGTNRRYRYNRAVGAHNKGDRFEADPGNPMVQALLGAGYADPVLEPVQKEQQRQQPDPALTYQTENEEEG